MHVWRCDVHVDVGNEGVVDLQQSGGYVESDVDEDADSSNNFFPGQPFRKNEYLPKTDGEHKIVCTPSIKGAASTNFDSFRFPGFFFSKSL